MFDGDKWSQRYARKALPTLVERAAECRTISFSEDADSGMNKLYNKAQVKLNKPTTDDQRLTQK